MRVVHLFAHAPEWRHSWERAASEVAEVVSVRTTGDRLAGGFGRVAHAEYLVSGVKFEPETLTRPLIARANRGRYKRLIDQIVLDHGPVDVLHGHFYSSALHVGSIPIPYVVSEHTSVFTRGERASVVRRSARVAQRVYESAALVMPVSHFLERAMQEAGIRARIHVLSNPVDVDAFPLSERPPVDAEIRVVCVQRLAQSKALDHLLRAFDIAHSSEPRLTLRIVGVGSDRAALEDLADSLGVSASVSFLGGLDRAAVSREMREAHAYAFSSRGDSFGLPVIEALCTGLPVVATAVGVVPEVVTETRGIIVSVGDVSGLARGLLHVAEHPERFPAQAVARGIRDRFSFATIGRELGKVYTSATNPGMAPTAR